MFAYNDIKYEVNKLRSHAYAEKRQEGLVYCPAKDTPSTEALRLRQDLPSQKIAWLNRHDRESGDLYGMLPLMFGRPVAVTEHMNHSYDKRILKGRLGHIHSWVLAPDERSVYEDNVRILHNLPKVVFVKSLADYGNLALDSAGLDCQGFVSNHSKYRHMVFGQRPSTSCFENQQTSTSVNAGVRDDVACRATVN